MCKVPFRVRTVIRNCSLDWSPNLEDKETYGEGWKHVSNKASIERIPNYPWKYRTLLENDGVPFTGTYGTYSGGGYVADLIGNLKRVQKRIEDLEKYDWFDRYTRGFFIEFSIYNPNVNMFSNIFISFEQSTTGEIVPEFFLKTFRLFSYIGGYGIFVLACEILAVIFVVYYLVREIRRIKIEGRQYFKSFWNFLEFSNLCLAIVSIVMYMIRHAIATLALRTVKKLRGN